MKNKSSILKSIMEDVYVSTSFDDALELVIEHIEASPISGDEGRKIINTAKQCGPSLTGLQTYITNSWFKYEGMGV